MHWGGWQLSRHKRCRRQLSNFEQLLDVSRWTWASSDFHLWSPQKMTPRSLSSAFPHFLSTTCQFTKWEIRNFWAEVAVKWAFHFLVALKCTCMHELVLFSFLLHNVFVLPHETRLSTQTFYYILLSPFNMDTHTQSGITKSSQLILSLIKRPLVLEAEIRDAANVVSNACFQTPSVKFGVSFLQWNTK